MLLLLSVVLLAIVAGYAAGGRLRNFERLRIRGWWLAPVGLLLQVQLPRLWHTSPNVSVALLIGSYVVLLVFAALNIRLAGFLLMFIGLTMNLTVVSVNHGMPVTRDALIASGQGDFLPRLLHGRSAKHHLADSSDVLLPLADVIPIPPPFAQVASAGDLVVFAGLVWLVVATMRGQPHAWIPARGRVLARPPEGIPPSVEDHRGQTRFPEAAQPGLHQIAIAGVSGVSTTLLIGDYAEGPYGPIILLEMMSLEAVRWLHRVFVGMITATGSVSLSAQPGVAFRRLSELELRLAPVQPSKHLQRADMSSRPRFVWSCSSQEWETHALFLEPFLGGRAGHQYLTDGTADDAIIEVSHGEAHFSP